MRVLQVYWEVAGHGLHILDRIVRRNCAHAENFIIIINMWTLCNAYNYAKYAMVDGNTHTQNNFTEFHQNWWNISLWNARHRDLLNGIIFEKIVRFIRVLRAMKFFANETNVIYFGGCIDSSIDLKLADGTKRQSARSTSTANTVEKNPSFVMTESWNLCVRDSITTNTVERNSSFIMTEYI